MAKIKGIQVVDNGTVLYDSEDPIKLDSELDIQLWMGGGVDFKKRIMELTGEVNEAMSSHVLRSMIRLNSLSHDPITIYFNSGGGSVYEGCAIYDILRDSQSPIVMIASGKIASMGIVIFLAGTIRMAFPNTRFMIHSVSHETGGTLKDTLIDVNEAKTLNDKMFSIIAERTKISKKSLLASTHDIWFDVTKATKWGLLTPTKTKKAKGKK